MTTKEFETKMENLMFAYEGDPEQMHARADELMCYVLKELGYGDGIAKFMLMRKWYA